MAKITQMCTFKKITQPRSNEFVKYLYYELCGASSLRHAVKHKFNLLIFSTAQTQYHMVLLHGRMLHVTEYFLRQTCKPQCWLFGVHWS
jgi:hypothetical protein